MTGSDDVIATLSARVSELSKRLGVAQSELDGANRRLAAYEEHDKTIQDAIAGALKAAYSIRERAEMTAAQILEQAREERRLLLNEIERLRDERDTLQEEIATQRRSSIAAVTPRPLSSDTVASELRAVAGEALRGLFQEIVDDMRATTRLREEPRAEAAPAAPPPAPPAAPPAAAASVAAAPVAPPQPMRRAPIVEDEVAPPPQPRIVEMPAAPAPPPVYEAPAAEPEPVVPAPTYEYMSRLAAARVTEREDVPAPVEEPAAEAAPEVPFAEAAPEAPVAEIAPTPPPVAPPEPAPAPTVTPREAPAADPWAAMETRSTLPPLEVVRPVEIEEIAPARVEAATPTTDIQVVLSPVPSFPRLVEIERHIQALPVVRTLYVRDFRGGAATLAVALRSAMTPDEFAGMLAGLQQPRLRLVSGSRNTIELRIEGEAGVA